MTPPALALDTTAIKPGLRLAVGLSGGADSVALTRALAARAAELGIVLHVAHLHHGLRGADADADQQFCADLAASLNLPFHNARVETANESPATPAKPRESIEEAARRLRYAWFRQLMASCEIDAVATAHTLDDQAETVLAKFLRGAWTEGFSAIHPIVTFPEGRILRPLLTVTRPHIEAYLRLLGQPWREDASNLDPAYTRNRLRHQLLPELEKENPRIRQHLAHLADLARDEEAYWETEISRLAPQLILTGKPVRGGGRASETGESIALDVVRLATHPRRRPPPPAPPRRPAPQRVPEFRSHRIPPHPRYRRPRRPASRPSRPPYRRAHPPRNPPVAGDPRRFPPTLISR